MPLFQLLSPPFSSLLSRNKQKLEIAESPNLNSCRSSSLGWNCIFTGEFQRAMESCVQRFDEKGLCSWQCSWLVCFSPHRSTPLLWTHLQWCPELQKTYHWDLWETPGLNIEASLTPMALATSWVWAFIIDVVTSVYQLRCHRASLHGNSWSEFCLVKLPSSVETFKSSFPALTGDLKWSQPDYGQEWVLLASPCCQFSDFRIKGERYLLKNGLSCSLLDNQWVHAN